MQRLGVMSRRVPLLKERTMLAYDYPILGLFWTMLIIFLWVAWIVLLFRVIADVFRSDKSGVVKAIWVLVLIFLPMIGVLVYLIANGGSMAERDVAAVQQQEAAFQSYVRSVAGTSGGTADELSKLADLKSKGMLTDEEFAAQKAKILSS
jgi:hypothetical protein